MSAIEYVHARQILDSRGNPTVEVDVAPAAARVRPGGGPVRRLDGRARGRRAARRRHGRYGGKGVLNAVEHVNDEIAVGGHGPRRRRPGGARSRALIALDGTDDKSRLGANAILGVSLAAARAAGGRRRPAAVVATSAARQPAAAADADAQRPQRRRARRQPGRLSGVHDRARRRRRRSPRRCGCGAEIYHALKAHAAFPRPGHRRRRRGRLRARPGVERGAARGRCSRPIEAAGYKPGEDVAIALDPASSEFYEDGAYQLAGEGRTLSSAGAGRLLGATGRAGTRSSRSRTAWPRTTGTAGSC